MLHEFSRGELLIGKNALEKLKNSRVAIYGIGGVGSFAVEGLVRAGVGKFILVDDDLVCLTNVNRQLHATRKTIGRPKVEVMRERILEINPKAEVSAIKRFYMPECAMEIIRGDEDYIVDAIDTVTAKLDLIVNAKKLGIPVISAMGAGNKLDPTRFEVSDIYKTSVDPLARVMRKELKKRGIDSLKVVYSKEEPLKPIETESSSCSESCVCPPGVERTCTSRRQIPGSISFVPSVAGLILAGEVVKDLIGEYLGSSANQPK
ncbi:MAG: tRNA threonylcarbamoyladenosine dehydratase [Clostridiaceae bacterium]|jgi:tRNA A37 threonylcarbamoyladenosine dehydratase|nr:tRNA threonylcarbamoyladenosine dehydratase [Clostridiaceae bacterium]